MKHYRILCGELSVWHSETGSSVAEFISDDDERPERITAIGRTDMDAIYSLIRAMADEGLITPTIGGIIDEDF